MNEDFRGGQCPRDDRNDKDYAISYAAIAAEDGRVGETIALKGDDSKSKLSATVTGPVQVRAGASLVADGGRISGTLTASGAAELHLLGTRVDGALTADRTGTLTVVGAELRGAASLTRNTAPAVSGTTVKGALSCTGNTPAPADLGVPNRVTGAGGGQCRDLREGPRGGSYEAIQQLAQ